MNNEILRYFKIILISSDRAGGGALWNTNHIDTKPFSHIFKRKNSQKMSEDGISITTCIFKSLEKIGGFQGSNSVLGIQK